MEDNAELLILRKYTYFSSISGVFLLVGFEALV